MHRFFLIISWLLSVSAVAYVQPLRPVYSAPSLQVVSLGECGTVPVNHFTETLYYNAERPDLNTGVQWGGNISSMEWDGTKAYDYAYDGLSRLIRAVYAGSASNSRQYSYDAHGNITGLTEGTTPQSYTYIGNHLSTSQYDANGNTTADAGTGIASVRYNVLNLPAEIVKSNGDTVRYTYNAAGAKLRESVIPVAGSPVHTDYVGNLVYRDDLLGRILIEGGAIAAKDSTLVPAYEFAFTYHLGSVRALVRAGEVRYRKAANQHWIYPWIMEK